MIKGVNHRVVEVTDTGNECFEKIMFFVSPDYAGLSEGKIRERAGKIASGTKGVPVSRKKSYGKTEIIVTVFLCLSCLAAGLFIGGMFG